jgi:hypothetical protein
MLRDLCDGPRAPLGSPSEVDGVGHRIVHGGERFRNPTRITGELKALVRTLTASAPLHNAAGLARVAVATGSSATPARAARTRPRTPVSRSRRRAVSPVRARPARSSPPPRAHRPDRARRAAGPAPVLEATRRSALSVNGCEVGDRFAAERHARRALRRADLRGGGRNRGVRHSCEPDSPRRCCCRSSRCREPRGVASGGWRDDRPPCALSRVELKTDRNDLASGRPACSSHASVARLSPACRPPSREDILYVIQGFIRGK